MSQVDKLSTVHVCTLLAQISYPKQSVGRCLPVNSAGLYLEEQISSHKRNALRHLFDIESARS